MSCRVIFVAFMMLILPKCITLAITIEEIIGLGLPLVEIETDEGLIPTAENADHPNGSSGWSITNVSRVSGRLRVWNDNGELEYDSGSYVEDVSGMVIKLRGNNSARRAQKPYNIKLQHKADLLNRGDDSKYKDKHWLLLKEDNNSLNTPIGFKVNELLGMMWTPAYRFVNVMMNGKYIGVYLLSESVRRNDSARLNIDSETGFLIERDIYWWNTNRWFQTSYVKGQHSRFTFKYPDADEILANRELRIKKAMEDVDYAVLNGNYEDVIDVESFVGWVLGHDILGTSDAGGSNQFYIKKSDDANDKVKMPLLWDFDTSYCTPDEWSMLHDYPASYFKPLFASDNSTFTLSYCRKWFDMSPHFIGNIKEYLDNFVTSKQAEAIDRSRRKEAEVCGLRYESVSQNAADVLQWFISRVCFLDKQIGELAKVNGITAPELKTTIHHDLIDLSGRHISNPRSKGLYIKGGKKWFYSCPASI